MSFCGQPLPRPPAPGITHLFLPLPFCFFFQNVLQMKAYAPHSGPAELSCYANPAPFLALHPLRSIRHLLPLPQAGCIWVVGLLRFGLSGIKPL